MLQHDLPTKAWPENRLEFRRAVRLASSRNHGIPRDEAEIRGLAPWLGRGGQKVHVTRDSLLVSYDNSISSGRFGTPIALNEANPILAGLSVQRPCPP
jgi:hypothetical protein